MPVIVERSPRKILRSIFVSLAFGVASGALAAQGSILAITAGAVGVVLFIGLGAAALVSYLPRRGPGLIVDDDGFDDRSSPLAVGRVPWSDVLLLYPVLLNKQWLIVVHVRKADIYLARLNWLFRMSARANRALAGTPITITASNLDTDTENLFDLLHEGFERHVAGASRG